MCCRGRWWFDPSQLALDPRQHEVNISLSHNRKGSKHPRLLRITDVLDVSSEPRVDGVEELCDIRFAAGSVRLILPGPREIALTVGHRCIVLFPDESCGPISEQSESTSNTAPFPEINIGEYGLADLVHDWYFDFDQFAFDKESHEACFYLGEHHKRPLGDKLLRVTHVLSIASEDGAPIGGGDINVIEVAADAVRIVGNIPNDILLTVGEHCRVVLLHKASDEGREWGRYESTTTLCRPPPLGVGQAIGNLLRRLHLKAPTS